MGKKTVKAVLLALLGAAGALAADAPREGVVVRAVENMYSAPDPDKDVVSQAFLGQSVWVIEVKEGFARIATPDRYEGWIPEGAISIYPSAEAPRYASTGRVAEVTSLLANVYRERDVTSARPKVVAPFGARLEVQGGPTDSRWFEVRLPSGEHGFIQMGDVHVAEAGTRTPRGPAAGLVATGRRLLGVPYLWGGMTPLGIDCSGFVSLVYRAHGRILPRDADLQFEDKDMAPVERASLLPGDLLFFGKSKDKITHVGLYAGNGRFLNATTYMTPVVREDRLDDPHWTELFQGARRPR
jgi:cell wall-associated NlpC family hydrolase